MADTKASAFTNAAGALTDRTPFIKDPAGTPLNRSMLMSALRDLLVSEGIVLPAGTTALAPLKMQSGTNLTTTEAGAFEFDGKVFYQTPVVGDRGLCPSVLFRCLTADASGSNVNTAQPWFPTNGAVAVRASTSYIFRGRFWSTRAAGSTSHTTGISFGGTATLTDITWWGLCKEGDTAAIADADLVVANTAANTNVKAASTSTTENILLWVEGIVRVNGAGTFIPQFTYSAAPGGAPSIKEGTMFLLYPAGSNTVDTLGTWT